ncbi:hypothetical protein [Bradyrhizobium oligotrophicum]|uniref:hypothetical protein n=1 Tax=Bradyrhizobium oligotrophicum TaxID=44255 RepID=UPI003EBFBE1F
MDAGEFAGLGKRAVFVPLGAGLRVDLRLQPGQHFSIVRIEDTIIRVIERAADHVDIVRREVKLRRWRCSGDDRRNGD